MPPGILAKSLNTILPVDTMIINAWRPMKIICVLYFSTDEADMDTITSFMQEAMVIKDLKHPNVVELVGVVLQRAAPPYIITPLTRNGDLGHFLKISRATSARVQVRTGLEFQTSRYY